MKLENCYTLIVCGSALMTTQKKKKKKRASLRTLWRKIKREKRRFFMSSSTVVHFQYDPSSYSHNFDDGYSTDPDCISRSFSSRFAALPSKIFFKNNNAQMVDDVDNNKFKSSTVL
ncbi:uncharacterized protein LOC130940124 [Arachis stenosperma]|uniref:uncharacterized protein LOC130940124 n=1 Tax=Arachis stenosperma TaxID=217475 RepID=UPI0025ACAF4F|nr:uncharacterized protein LOC130940124 [Arachis stenosperma]